MSDQTKRKRGRPVGWVKPGSVNARLVLLDVGETTVWLSDDSTQPVRWQRHIAARRSMRGELAGREFATESGVLVLAGQKVEYALKIRRYV